ncbi:protein aubergine [Culex quinquefasciatus]|nr:protein aubergine [Culex quinquefasciatus]
MADRQQQYPPFQPHQRGGGGAGRGRGGPRGRGAPGGPRGYVNGGGQPRYPNQYHQNQSGGGYEGGNGGGGNWRNGNARGGWNRPQNNGGQGYGQQRQPRGSPQLNEVVSEQPPVAEQPEVRVDAVADQQPVQRNAQAAGDRGGRGTMRSGRAIPDVVRTRAADCQVTKHGSSGRPIALTANYFRVMHTDGEAMFMYRVDFVPDIESVRVRKALMHQLKPTLGAILFDGGSMFMSRDKTRNDESEITTKELQSQQDYLVKIKKVGTIDWTSEMALTVLNLINRRGMGGLRLQQIGRNFFDPNGKVRIAEFGLELYPGYITSIRQHEQDILMCAEVTHKVMREDTCYGILRSCMANGGNWQADFTRAILGTVVMATYGRNSTYTVNDVEFNTTPEHSFETANGRMTFLEYYRNQYNIVIRDPRQPMLVSRARARDIRAGRPELLYLVPELMRATGLTDEMRRNFTLMRALADHTRLTPDRRMQRLEAFNQRLQQTPESIEIFRYWKTELDRRLVELPGRVLHPEKILFHEQQLNMCVTPDASAEWQMAFRNNQMYRSERLQNWFLMVPRSWDRLVPGFVECLRQAARGMRFEVADPQLIRIDNDSPMAYVSALNQIVNRDPQLIMCIVSNDKADRYAAIKTKCCVERAIATQVIKAKTITPKGGNVRTLMSVATKVAIQLNCKIGGIPWIVTNPLRSVMVIGFDVCHDTRNRSRSFGALVATSYHESMKHPRFFSTVNHHSAGEELSNYMAQNVVKALRAYRDEFQNLPNRIIIYRDGVGDGQLKYVHDLEITSIKEKLKLITKDAPTTPKLTFLVVSKRINTRLFHDKRNPVPGTIVDDVITLPERNDFYLVSQSVRQGTVSPTSYNVLYDESGLTADQLQVYTYKQTHLYYNWSGTVGVPAVCQYAHKLAALAGQHLHQAPHSDLEKKLYYL